MPQKWKKYPNSTKPNNPNAHIYKIYNGIDMNIGVKKKRSIAKIT
jgi:hypothetical protein